MSAHLKTPLNVSLDALTTRKGDDALQLKGKALPCTVVSAAGAIITVNFELNSGFTLPHVTMPLFGPEYIRYPIQPGDKGLAIPADAYLGGMSGLGGGVASLDTPANLSAMVFLPIGNTAWAAVDPQAVTVYGPDGVVLRDTASNSTFVLTPTSITAIGKNSVTVTAGGATLSLNAASGAWSLSGSTGNLTSTTGNLTITDQAHHTSPSIMNSAWQALVTWLNAHQHTDPQGGNTGAPTSPFTGGSIAP